MGFFSASRERPPSDNSGRAAVGAHLTWFLTAQEQKLDTWRTPGGTWAVLFSPDDARSRLKPPPPPQRPQWAVSTGIRDCTRGRIAVTLADLVAVPVWSVMACNLLRQAAR